MANIAIFGGTFNPIHKGHILLLEQVISKYDFNKVIIIPSNTPPHKKAISLASNTDRLNLCSLATKYLKKVYVSDIEFKIKGASYSYNTLKKLKEKYKNDNLFLIIGGDMAMSFDNWYKSEEILKLVNVVAGAREKGEFKKLKDKIRVSGQDIDIVETDLLPISSTVIRMRIAQGLNCDKFLAKEVQSYIDKNNLYKGENVLFDECSAIAQKLESEQRFSHSLNVAKAAYELAKIYDYDENDAKVAAILHDVMKNKTQGELLSFFEKNDIILTEIEKKSPKTWHAIAGYYYAYNTLLIENQEILSAIRYHTTAKINMSLLEKIIYVADYICDGRNFKDVNGARQLAKIDLDLAVLHSLSNVIFKLSRELSPIHPNSLECYNDLIVNKNKSIEEKYFEN